MKTIRRSLKRAFPLTFGVLRRCYQVRSVTFDGWGMMTSSTLPPWAIEKQWQPELLASFVASEERLLAESKEGRFVAAQFRGEDFGEVLASLRWRHYLLFNLCASALLRTASRKGPSCVVECGVCDGVSSFFLIQALLTSAGDDWRLHLYDSWEGMRSADLLKAEQSLSGAYSFLSLDNTQKNLNAFRQHLDYHQGFIPDTLHVGDQPDEIHFLHVDLNSARATREALNFFIKRMSPNGIIIFDDYGWIGHTDTRKAVDEFAAKNDLHCLQLPTGQAYIVVPSR